MPPRTSPSSSSSPLSARAQRAARRALGENAAPVKKIEKKIQKKTNSEIDDVLRPLWHNPYAAGRLVVWRTPFDLKLPDSVTCALGCKYIVSVLAEFPLKCEYPHRGRLIQLHEADNDRVFAPHLDVLDWKKGVINTAEYHAELLKRYPLL
jgi:hypothetical protein